MKAEATKPAIVTRKKDGPRAAQRVHWWAAQRVEGERIGTRQARGMVRFVYDTKISRFMDVRNIHPNGLARGADVSRQHLLRIRRGTMHPTLFVILSLVAACIAITGDSTITAFDLFELAPSKQVVSDASRRLGEKRARWLGTPASPRRES